MQVTKDMLVGDILATNPELSPHFLALGMHCLGCPSARFETIEQACATHNADADELVITLNKALNEG